MKHNNLLLSFLMLLFFVSSCTPKSTPKSSEELLKREGLPVISRTKDCPFDLYMCQGEISSRANLFLDGNKIQIAKLIIEKSIYSTNPLKVDRKNLINTVNNMYPSKTASGYGILDWEGKAMHILEKSDPKSKEFQDMLSQYIYALTIAQEQRPNVKWGYYGFPLRDYWNRNDAWKARTLALMPIFKKADIICPSIYDFYEKKFVGTEPDSLYVNDNVVLALEMGAKTKTPVLPFVYHRYHPSNKRVGGELIPVEEFGEHIDAALKASYKSRKIGGIVWWGADRWSYNAKNKLLVKEASKSKSFDKYQDKVIIDYAQKIYDLFEENCK